MTIKEQVKALWKLCFNDPDAFIELYFQHKYTNKVSYTIESGGEVIAALQALPYQMTWGNNILSTAYISGACTHPDYRKRGVMAQLLAQTFTRLNKESIPFTFLIPATVELLHYYRRFGFAPVFVGSMRVFTADMLHECSVDEVQFTTEYSAELYAYVSAQMLRRAAAIRQSADDLRVVLKDLFLAGGNTVVAFRNDAIVGVAFVVPSGDEVMVKDCLADDEETAHALYQKSMERYRKSAVRVLMPMQEEDEDVVVGGMLRILHAQTVLGYYASLHPEKEKYIEVQDDQLSSNNGYYYLHDGLCEKSDSKQPRFTYDSLSIGELAECVFSSVHPFLSLMLN